MRTEQLYLRIAPEKFHYLKFILEGYDNLAILSSHSGKEGIVRVRFPQCLTKDVFRLLEGLAPYLC